MVHRIEEQHRNVVAARLLRAAAPLCKRAAIRPPQSRNNSTEPGDHLECRGHQVSIHVMALLEAPRTTSAAYRQSDVRHRGRSRATLPRVRSEAGHASVLVLDAPFRRRPTPTLTSCTRRGDCGLVNLRASEPSPGLCRRARRPVVPSTRSSRSSPRWNPTTPGSRVCGGNSRRPGEPRRDRAIHPAQWQVLRKVSPLARWSTKAGVGVRERARPFPVAVLYERG